MDSLFEDAPALTEEHARLARSLARFVEIEIEPRARFSRDPQVYREMAALLAHADLLRYAVALPSPPLDMRALCIVRERLAHASPAADYLLATQGLASYPLALAAPDHLRDFWLSRITAGRAIAAISLPTDDAGPTARHEDGLYRLEGTAPFALNAGLADLYTIFARVANANRPAGSSRSTAFVIGARMAGLEIEGPQETATGYPIAHVKCAALRVPIEEMIGNEGDGERILRTTRDAFLLSHAAAACGMAERALHEILARDKMTERARRLWAELRAARSLLYEAAHCHDTKPETVRLDLDREAFGIIFDLAHRIIAIATEAIGRESLIGDHPVERMRRGLPALRLLF
jgi:acyl-CoA dehydrogenase